MYIYFWQADEKQTASEDNAGSIILAHTAPTLKTHEKSWKDKKKVLFFFFKNSQN